MNKYVTSIKKISLLVLFAGLLLSFQNCGQPGELSGSLAGPSTTGEVLDTDTDPPPTTPPIDNDLPDECANFAATVTPSMSTPVVKRGSTTLNSQSIPFSVGMARGSGDSANVDVTTNMSPNSFNSKPVSYEFSAQGLGSTNNVNFLYTNMDGDPIEDDPLASRNGIRLSVDNNGPVCVLSGSLPFQFRARARCTSSNGTSYTKDVNFNMNITFSTGSSGNGYLGCLPTSQLDEGSDPNISSANFGTSVAIKGNVAVVGAKNYGSQNNGQAYIYQINNDGSANKTATISSPSGITNGQLNSVAVSDNSSIVYAGFPRSSSSATGMVVIYSKSDSTWSKAATTLSGINNFGYALATAGNFLAIGEPAANGFAGAVQVFQNSGSSWSQCATITSPKSNLFFGSALSMSGDKLVIGSQSTIRSGEAYLYTVNSDCSYSQNFLLTHPSGSSTDKFGQAVSVSGNGIVVGAPGSNKAFYYSTASSSPVKTLSGSGQFGISVAIDTVSKQIVVGALDDDGQGSAEYFSLNSSSSNSNYKIMDHSRKNGGKFGSAVAISAGRAIIGSKNDNPQNATQAGSAFIMELP